jgi:hypothetical protein
MMEKEWVHGQRGSMHYAKAAGQSTAAGMAHAQQHREAATRG